MVTLFSILLAVAVGSFLIMNSISSKRLSEVRALESQKHSLQSKLEFMINQRNDLRKDVEDKERELTSLKNSREGIPISVPDLDIAPEDDDHRVSRYLLKQGKLSLEQNEKVLKKMSVLKMDYLGTSLALGFIDLETAQQIMKMNKS